MCSHGAQKRQVLERLVSVPSRAWFLPWTLLSVHSAAHTAKVIFQLSKNLLSCATCNLIFFSLRGRKHLHLLFQSAKNNLQAVLLSDEDPLVSSVS